MLKNTYILFRFKMYKWKLITNFYMHIDLFIFVHGDGSAYKFSRRTVKKSIQLCMKGLAGTKTSPFVYF